MRWRLIATILMAIAAPTAARAQQVVIASLPSAVGFGVTNVSQSTIGTPDPTTASFTIVNLLLFHVLRVSVRADSNFVPPGGTAIPASTVSWTTSNASGGTGSNGTLSTSSYGQVFQSSAGLLGLCSVDIRWTMAAPGAAIRAGNHTMVVRWRLEAIVP